METNFCYFELPFQIVKNSNNFFFFIEFHKIFIKLNSYKYFSQRKNIKRDKHLENMKLMSLQIDIKFKIVEMV